MGRGGEVCWMLIINEEGEDFGYFFEFRVD